MEPLLRILEDAGLDVSRVPRVLKARGYDKAATSAWRHALFQLKTLVEDQLSTTGGALFMEALVWNETHFNANVPLASAQVAHMHQRRGIDLFTLEVALCEFRQYSAHCNETGA